MRINWLTLAVVLVVLAGLGYAVHRGLSAEQIAALAAAAVAITSQLAKLVERVEKPS